MVRTAYPTFGGAAEAAVGRAVRTILGLFQVSGRGFFVSGVNHAAGRGETFISE